MVVSGWYKITIGNSIFIIVKRMASEQVKHTITECVQQRNEEQKKLKKLQLLRNTATGEQQTKKREISKQ